MTPAVARGRRLRPGRPRALLVGSPAVLGVGWLVVHNSGAGWVQVLGDVVLATLLVGVLGPAVVASRASLRLESAPSDATSSLPVELRVTASTRLRVRPLDPPGPEALVGPGPKGRNDTDPVTLLPPRRGVFDRVVLQVATAAPFGVQWWTRELLVALPTPLFVAPCRGVPFAVTGWGAAGPDQHAEPPLGVGDRRAAGPAEAGDLRGVRPYRPGDRRQQVHWGATAHAGELLVRQHETVPPEPPEMVVSLPDDPDAAEALAGRALATVVSVLDRGGPVLLTTTEAAGTFTAAVTDRRGARRRLAAATGPAGDYGPEACKEPGVRCSSPCSERRPASG